MSYALILRPRAEHDIAEAALWYGSREPGAALHFIRCVDAAMAHLVRYPQLGPVQFAPFRRVLVSRYPFSVFYTIEDETILVHGVFHNSRDAGKIRKLLNT